MIRLGLLGASGRMGRSVAQIVASDYAGRATLSASPSRGDSLDSLLDSQVIIDFASPQAVVELIRAALERKATPALVVGSTGWTPDQKQWLEKYAAVGAVLQSSNFSLGVQALLKILRDAAPLLRRLGYKPAMTETHHVHKKDAPSGTALAIEAAVRSDGSAAFPIQSVREGEVIGLHELDFVGPADHLVFRHEALDRTLFARGAVEVALWMTTRPASKGWVSTADFLTHVGGR